MKIKRLDKNQVFIEYRYAGHYVRRIIGLNRLTEFLEGAALEESNLGPKGSIKFKDFCKEWYLPRNAKHRLKAKTYARELEVVKALGIYFGDKELHIIERQDWEKYAEGRLAGNISARGKACSEGTVKKEFKSLRMILGYAKELGFVRRNILSDVKANLSDGNRSDIWLTKDEIKSFLSKIPDNLRVFSRLFEFRIWTGARPEEASLFGKENINWETGEIWIVNSKKRRKEGESRRYFRIKSLGPRFEGLLRSLEPHKETGLFFCNPKTGQSYAPRYVLKVFDKAIESAGIKKRLPVNPYDLRGTFATHRAMVVKSFRQLQTEMGHLSPESIEHYLDIAGHYKPEESIFYGADENESEGPF